MEGEIFVNSDDRRIRKTKKALRESLAELMLEKELRSISVRELADTADVHRATFYTHYKDIYDLYEQLENAVVEELSEIITNNTPNTYEKLFSAIVDYVYENAGTCRMLFNKNGNRNFYDRVSTLLEEIYISDWLDETGKTEVTEEWRFFAKYHIQGCLAIVNRWADSNYLYPKNEIIDFILRASTNFDEMMPE